jgi:hypothetical protein
MAGLGALAAGGLGAPALARARPAAVPPADSLTGVWTHAWYTHLQRPKDLPRLVVTPAEAAAYEAPRKRLHGDSLDAEDEVGQSESEFPDQGPGLARIRGEIRSSWIVDPPDGRIPWTAAARARLHLDKPAAENADDPEARDTDEQCLTANGSGVPLLNAHDTNVVTIVQAPGHVVIVSENNHATRIVRLADAGEDPASWWGTSLGHWEGKTLAVETHGLRPGLTRIANDLTLSDQSRVTERFTRTGPDEIAYGFWVQDPTLFTQAWRGEMVFRRSQGAMFEFACHEGNYGLPDILAMARRMERAK